MYALNKLFGKSPIHLLQVHMAKVGACVRKILDIFPAIEEGNSSLLTKLSEEISKLEHEADLVKGEIRNDLPRGLFLAIDRKDLVDILAMQDEIADKAENIAFLTTLMPLKLGSSWKEVFYEFLQKNISTFEMMHRLIKELDELFQSSFGGLEADKVKKMIDSINLKEHEVDEIQHKLLKKFFLCADKLTSSEVYLWNKIFTELSDLSNHSERLANRVRLLLEVR